jgi:hypothetical protein
MKRSTLLAVLLPLVAACGGDSGPEPNLTGSENPEATVFLTESELPAGYMDALFQGRVVRDEQGCLRLESAQPATVIWPVGSTLESRDGALYVKDGAGRELAKIGAVASFGGGYVPSAEYASLSARDRSLAQTRCPGQYWLAGPAAR